MGVWPDRPSDGGPNGAANGAGNGAPDGRGTRARTDGIAGSDEEAAMTGDERYARPGAPVRDDMLVATRPGPRLPDGRRRSSTRCAASTCDVARGELLAVRGRSGSGKTTLLNLLGGLDQPTAGTVIVDGTPITGLDDDAAAKVRRETVAFIFQTFGLIPILTAAENVEVPLRLVGAEPRERDRRVAELLELVGLDARARHRPHELSGGEQQRVAIARALANRPQAAPRRRAHGAAGLRDRAPDHAAHPDGGPGRRASRRSSRPTTR